MTRAERIASLAALVALCGVAGQVRLAPVRFAARDIATALGLYSADAEFVIDHACRELVRLVREAVAGVPDVGVRT